MSVKRRLQVTIKRRGGLDRDRIVEMIVRSVIAEIVSTRLANTLHITVECRVTKLDKDLCGQVFWNPVEDVRCKEYRILIQRDAPLQELAETIAHEIRHVEQFARGRLRFGTKNGVSGAFWRAGTGATVFFPNATTDYWTAPWEVEALATEVLGVKALNKTRARASTTRAT